MLQDTAINIFEDAKKYCEEKYLGDIELAISTNFATFKSLRSKRFLAEYCWVVYVSGFKVSIIEAIFPDLQAGFKDFNLEKLSRMRSLKSVLDVFNNERKANSFLKGSKIIAEEGFSDFKKRLEREGVDMLENLPGIGPITKYQLAKNIGLIDGAKPDIWLVRAAEACSTTVEELVEFLSKKYGLTRHTVDVIIWRYCADNGLVF